MARKIAILVHGLNNTPNVMHSSKAYFEALGYECYNWVLSGHKKFVPSVRLQHYNWRDDIKEAYDFAKEKNPNELIFIGFSLGALSCVNSSQHYGLKWDKIVFFSPALALRPRINFFTPFYYLQAFPVPSFTPYKIMKYWILPSSYIRSIQLLIERLKPESITEELLVVTSKRDEVLNWKKVRDKASSYGQNVKSVFVKGKRRKWNDYGHLTAGPKYMSKGDWVLVEEHLNSILPHTQSNP